MNGIDFPVAKVLDGIDAATRGRSGAGQGQHGRSGAASTSRAWCRWPAGLARPASSCDSSNTWTSVTRMAGDSTRSCRPPTCSRRSARSGRSKPADASYRGEVADRWTYLDGGGEFGVISSVSQPFCRDCTRARISAEGKLYTCLFAVDGQDLRSIVLRSDATDEALAAFIEATGCVAATGTPSCAPRRRRRCRRSRCSRWAADGRFSTACPQPPTSRGWARRRPVGLRG